MSWNHTTVGFDTFNGFIRALRLFGITPKVEEILGVVDVGPYGAKRNFQRATFRLPGRKHRNIVEEYLAVKDCDCDGVSCVNIAVYPEGKRPNLEALCEVLEA